MTRSIRNIDIDEAKQILRYAYEQDNASTYQGAWQTKRHVSGSVITMTWDAHKHEVRVSANAISSETSLCDYVHPDYRDQLEHAEKYPGTVKLYSGGASRYYVDPERELAFQGYEASTAPFRKDAQLWTIEWGPLDAEDSFEDVWEEIDWSWDTPRIGDVRLTLLATYEDGEITRHA